MSSLTKIPFENEVEPDDAVENQKTSEDFKRFTRELLHYERQVDRMAEAEVLSSTTPERRSLESLRNLQQTSRKMTSTVDEAQKKVERAQNPSEPIQADKECSFSVSEYSSRLESTVQKFRQYFRSWKAQNRVQLRDPKTSRLVRFHLSGAEATMRREMARLTTLKKMIDMWEPSSQQGLVEHPNSHKDVNEEQIQAVAKFDRRISRDLYGGTFFRKIHIDSTSAASRSPENDESQNSNLTHVDGAGAASMVSVADKRVTKRTAYAINRVRFSDQRVVGLVRNNELTKGDVLSVARIAGITGAKRTSDLIPLCHPLALTKISVDLEVLPPSSEGLPKTLQDTAQHKSHSRAAVVSDENGMIWIETKAEAVAKTGVEMEALVAAQIAGLVVYDMCKSVDKGMEMGPALLVHKSGGKRGQWEHPDWERLEDFRARSSGSGKEKKTLE